MLTWGKEKPEIPSVSALFAEVVLSSRPRQLWVKASKTLE